MNHYQVSVFLGVQLFESQTPIVMSQFIKFPAQTNEFPDDQIGACWDLNNPMNEYQEHQLMA